jgi:hypothetical protein
MGREEELSPEFIKRFNWLKWEFLRTGVSLDVLQCTFPKPLIYKHLKEEFTMHQSVANLSRQKKRHLKKLEKLEPLYYIPLEEYELMTSTQHFF